MTDCAGRSAWTRGRPRAATRSWHVAHFLGGLATLLLLVARWLVEAGRLAGDRPGARVAGGRPAAALA